MRLICRHFAVNFIGWNMHKAFDAVHFGTFQQNMRANDVVFTKLQRIAKWIIDVRLRSQMQNLI